VFGGAQWRPFLHVADAADAFAFAVEKGMEGTYNVVWKNLTIRQAAKDVARSVPARITLSKDIVDRRDYRVSGAKASKFGVRPRRDIAHAAKEFRTMIADDVRQYRHDRYSNYKSFFNSKSIQKKIYTRGPIFK